MDRNSVLQEWNVSAREPAELQPCLRLLLFELEGTKGRECVKGWEVAASKKEQRQ